ncbi:MAG: hypothetical protein JXA11_15725 [Phycisphaerae bacterium]|nr:hypothetical protein [Phycisphaerae bacterium]
MEKNTESPEFLVISLVGEHSRSLLTDFDDAGVSYEERHPQPGVFMNAGDAVILAGASILAATRVLVAWIKYSSTRKLMITLSDNKIVQVQAEGISVAEFEQLLKAAKQVMVMDTKKQDHK